MLDEASGEWIHEYGLGQQYHAVSCDRQFIVLSVINGTTGEMAVNINCQLRELRKDMVCSLSKFFWSGQEILGEEQVYREGKLREARVCILSKACKSDEEEKSHKHCGV